MSLKRASSRTKSRVAYQPKVSKKNPHLLEGLLILDLSRVMSGPFASMLLGDYGAEVIKVEDTERGDETRLWYPPTIEGESAYFLSANRNKKDIALNLKTTEGLEILYKLAQRCGRRFGKLSSGRCEEAED